MKNARTMFKVMNEFKKNDTPSNNVNGSVVKNNYNNINDEVINNTNKDLLDSPSEGGPTFFA